jgi:hypothetical protein
MKMLFHGRDCIDKVIVVGIESGVIKQIEFIVQQPKNNKDSSQIRREQITLHQLTSQEHNH